MSGGVAAWTGSHDEGHGKTASSRTLHFFAIFPRFSTCQEAVVGLSGVGQPPARSVLEADHPSPLWLVPSCQMVRTMGPRQGQARSRVS